MEKPKKKRKPAPQKSKVALIRPTHLTKIKETRKLNPKTYQVHLNELLGLQIVSALLFAGYSAEEIAKLKILDGTWSEGRHAWFTRDYLDLIEIKDDKRALVEAVIPSLEGIIHSIFIRIQKISIQGEVSDKDTLWLKYLEQVNKTVNTIKDTIGPLQLLKTSQEILRRLREKDPKRRTEKEAIRLLSAVLRDIIIKIVPPVR